MVRKYTAVLNFNGVLGGRQDTASAQYVMMGGPEFAKRKEVPGI
jgi:hypothetical protein